MTNGEKLKEIFTTCKSRQSREDIVEITLDGVIGICVMADWWNAPYKTGSEEE